MDPFNAGALSLLPPIIAITLALCTKEVFSSLMIGILSGSLIYTVGMGQDFVIVRTIETAFAVMVKKVDFRLLPTAAAQLEMGAMMQMGAALASMI